MSYSKTTKGLLDAASVRPGDRVRITSGSVVVEGLILPRIELGDTAALTLKLDNGYNIGLRPDSDSTIERMDHRQELEQFPTRDFPSRDDLPAISLIATGGTIASRVSYRTGAVHMLMKPEEVFYSVPELADVVTFRNVLSPFTIASEDMTFREYQQLAKAVASELNDGALGAVLTHGTDTLHFTAAALSFMLKGLRKPVCLVGAQRSADRGSFDGPINLICGSRIAATSDIAGVTLVMHGESDDSYCLVTRGTKVRKLHTSRRDAFRPVNAPPIAKAWPDGRIEVLDDAYVKRDDAATVTADTAMEEKVALLKVCPNQDPGILHHYIDKGFRGIVVEATGLGHVPTQTLDKKKSWLPAIERAREEGMVVCFAPQCMYGRLDPYVYENARLMLERGVTFLEDMLPETAYIKLAWVLGHTSDVAEAQRMMLDNIAGEVSPGSDPATFRY